jgi:hypothetical protein
MGVWLDRFDIIELVIYSGIWFRDFLFPFSHVKFITLRGSILYSYVVLSPAVTR